MHLDYRGGNALNTINIALAQIDCKVGDKDYNIGNIEQKVKDAGRQGANIVVFPELTLTGYSIRDLAYELAEPIPGPSVNRLVGIAKKERMYVVCGMPERSGRAQAVLYNTAMLLGPEGYIGKYQKMYLPTHSIFEEKRYFRPGNRTPVFQTSIGKVGLLVCYDIFFPEVSRILRLKGAQLIICISASPSRRRRFFEVLTTARAIENTAFLAYVNLVGVEDGLQFWGGSRLIAPNGTILAQARYDEEDLAVVSIDLADLKRTEIFVPTLRDLRPELYESLREETKNL
ncbi:MAG: carbon-nitrogen hydrolase family protein [Candidatus Bathyarchaeota archaeon]|nr:MAG: carbon-nitrogen hydrolase family protein [Candidatus Bathyarchaeota archaeon]